ncbi:MULTISPECIES: hypothetical protein [Clostridium]|uniref:hypothetical protein n=1 Tax=Clostridium TaxID=1485 RepID=UPI00069ECC0C|nr:MULTISPECIES: hypothetical protein [Clostridium]KOF57876.1 hypothetical protein AGR56_16915 [Clostridium sp. DMHC 10]MCD2348344.1 hypothetical protein [Clostridium guangxiense]
MDNKADNKTLISKFIMKEVEQIYMKYSAIEEEELNIVADFIKLLEENKIDFDPYVDYRAMKAMLIQKEKKFYTAIKIYRRRGKIKCTLFKQNRI